MRGDGGRDTLLGNDGADSLDGGIGVDSLDGGDGNDLLYARFGDKVFGGNNDDLISLQESGVAILNGWLATKVRQFEKNDLARTYVLVESGHKTVSGFYSLSNHTMVYESLPTGQARGLPGTSSDVAIP